MHDTNSQTAQLTGALHDMMDQHPVVLLSESDALIGMDPCDALEKAGYRVVGPVGTMAEALQHLEQDRPTLAVIDVLLRDGRCTALAPPPRPPAGASPPPPRRPPDDEVGRA